jgi:MSHA biogenesis protein MshN
MSLINDVLRDLDERRLERDGERGECEPFEGLRPTPAPSAGRGPRSRGREILPLALAAGLALLLSVPREPGPEELPAVATGSLGESAEPADAAARAEPREVTATPLPRPPGPLVAVPVPASRAPFPEPEAPEAAELATPAPELDFAARPLGSERRARARRAYRQALEREARGESARADLEQSLALDPGHQPARVALATLLARGGRPEDAATALALLAEGRRIADEPGAFTDLEARIRAGRGEVAEALALLETASAPLPRGAEAHALRAALYQRSGRHGEAARLYADLLGNVGGRGVWWLGLAISREAEGRPAEALSAYRAARKQTRGPGSLDPATRGWIATRIESLARTATSAPAKP